MNVPAPCMGEHEEGREAMFVDKPAAIGLSEQEFDDYANDGWSTCVDSDMSQQIYTERGQGVASMGPVSRYFFCRPKSAV